MYADVAQIYYSFPFTDFTHANGIINEELRSLFNVSKDYSLNLNPADCVEALKILDICLRSDRKKLEPEHGLFPKIS